MDAQRFVYALVDPREPAEVRYVGCTLNVPRRLYQHQWEAMAPDDHRNPYKRRWLRGLLLLGIQPVALVLETVAPGDDYLACEQHWIEVHRTPALTNFERPLPPPDDGVRTGEWGGGRFW